ncbi:hypothetical protein CTZ27_28655 [Streptomyces griseocarneus]|nr:hypothetical protein CTZ27_28655 [Streptomyces griseocarneus]
MTAQEENAEDEGRRPINWVDPKKARIVEHYVKEVQETIQTGRRGCRNCGGLGKIVMVVNGEPQSYACSCGG